MRLFGGEPLRATGGTEIPRDSMLPQPWPVVRSELDRLGCRVDEHIDPAIRVIEAVVAGFHGIGPEADPEMADMFSIGARDRDRISRLEQELRALRRTLEDMTSRVRT
jgi:hypothetical protein